ncbi:unnamed protein product [Phaeothamnion confervicola]
MMEGEERPEPPAAVVTTAVTPLVAADPDPLSPGSAWTGIGAQVGAAESEEEEDEDDILPQKAVTVTAAVSPAVTTADASLATPATARCMTEEDGEGSAYGDAASVATAAGSLTTVETLENLGGGLHTKLLPCGSGDGGVRGGGPRRSSDSGYDGYVDCSSMDSGDGAGMAFGAGGGGKYPNYFCCYSDDADGAIVPGCSFCNVFCCRGELCAGGRDDGEDGEDGGDGGRCAIS